jgi:hypothetical protein
MIDARGGITPMAALTAPIHQERHFSLPEFRMIKTI